MEIVVFLSPILQDIPGFPYKQYQTLVEEYLRLQQWFDGDVLDAKVVDEQTGSATDKYPIHINPLPGTARKHTSAVLGQNVDSIRVGGVPIRVSVSNEISDDEKASVEDFVENVLEQSQFGALLQENVLTSQYLGGSVFGIDWVAAKRTIRVIAPKQTEFYAVPDGYDKWTLKEAWIVREITEDSARAYGYDSDAIGYFYTEHWTPDAYVFRVNEKVLVHNGIRFAGENVYGFVPFVYIPHLRETGFWGKGIITKMVEGLIREINLRWADIGDAVSIDAHNIVAMANVRTTPDFVDLGGQPVVDLGAAPGIANNDAGPKLWAVGTKSASEPMLRFTGGLDRLYRREVSHPAVADGEDEGSQRSSLTLTTRMWPLVAEAERERMYLSIGIGKLCEMIVAASQAKGILPESSEELHFTVQWQNMLPRDRENLVNEAAVREKHKLGSRRHLIEMFGDTSDVEKELAEIAAETEKEQENDRFIP